MFRPLRLAFRSTRPLGAALLLALCSAVPLPAATLTYPAAPSGPAFNPERGIHAFAPLETATNFNTLRSQGYALVLGAIELDAFRTQSISAAKLNEITAAFGRIRTAGQKAIIRIRYNSDISGEDASLAWMETHLQQLQPVLAANNDVIFAFNAGMIGAWGEWHTSSNGLDTPAGRAAVWNLLVTYLPAGSFIMVRTPEYVNALEGLDLNPLTPAEAFTGTSRARIGHHNDCFIASDTDYGTYPPPGPQQTALKLQIGEQSRYTPWTGETCDPDPLNATCSRALTELAAFHATSISGQYHPQVIANLTTEGCWTEIVDKLGYRLQLTSATLPSLITQGQPFNYEIRLRNVGWAPLYNERPVFLRLLNASGGVVQDYQLTGTSADPRRWLPEAGDIVLSGTLTAPATIGSATAQLALWLPDRTPALRSAPDYSIQFANTGVWNASTGTNLLISGVPVQSGPGAIDIDGSFADWDRFSPVLTDPSGDLGAGLADYTQLWIADDSTYLYFRIQTANSADLFLNGRCNFFFDTDQNGATGFPAVAGTIGSELMLQAGVGYQQKNGGFNEGTVSGLGLLRAPTGAATDVEFRVARAALFGDSSPVFPGSGLRILLESETSGFVTQDVAPNTGVVGYTYGTNLVPVELTQFMVE